MYEQTKSTNKACRSCGEALPAVAYRLADVRTGRLRRECRACEAAAKRDSRERQRIREISRLSARSNSLWRAGAVDGFRRAVSAAVARFGGPSGFADALIECHRMAVAANKHALALRVLNLVFLGVALCDRDRAIGR